MRRWFEVRVREKVGPDLWVKKSKFYQANSGGEAVGRYKGLGSIISVRKVGIEELLGVGEFFRIGDELLKEFSDTKKGG